MIKIKELLLPDGIVLIGIYDNVYKEHYPYDECFIYQLFIKHFKSVKKINKNERSEDKGQWIIKLEYPY